MATCRINEIDWKYANIECSLEAWDQDPNGLCLLHSHKEDKDNESQFTEAIKAKFKEEDYDFRGVFFPGFFFLSELTGVQKFTFAKPADFFMATFQEETHFSWATLSGEARLVFYYVNPPDKAGRRLPFQADFRNLILQAASPSRPLLRFHDTSLARVEFLGTDLCARWTSTTSPGPPIAGEKPSMTRSCCDNARRTGSPSS